MTLIPHNIDFAGVGITLLDFEGSSTVEFALKELQAIEANGRVLRRPPHDFDGALLDVGANVGLWSCLWSRLYPKALVVAVEPVPATAAILKENLQRNALSKFTVVHGAIAPEGVREVSMRVPYGNPGAASAIYPHRGEEVIVKGLSLRDLFRLVNAPTPVGVLKVDIEGMEYSTLLEHPAETVERCDLVHVEMHGFAGLPDYLCKAVHDRFEFEVLKYVEPKNLSVQR